MFTSVPDPVLMVLATSGGAESQQEKSAPWPRLLGVLAAPDTGSHQVAMAASLHLSASDYSCSHHFGLKNENNHVS